MGFRESKTARKRIWGSVPPPFAENISVVLVHPKRGENVGATARAMNNFGFKRMKIVGGGLFDRRQAEYVAKDSEDIVKGAEIFEEVSEATKGAVLIVGTTAREIDYRKNFLSIKSAAKKIALQAVKGEIAILFGPEWRGLSDAEQSQCSTLITIPTGGPQPSLNLAQAAVIVCYELYCALADPPERPVKYAPASSKSVEGLWGHLEQTIEYIDFMPETGEKRIAQTLKDMLYRAEPDEREVTILRGVLRKLSWYLKQIPKKEREKGILPSKGKSKKEGGKAKI